MDRNSSSGPAIRSVAGLDDERDLSAAIDAALAVSPVDERLLRLGVFTYVGAERDAGVSPGHVVLALTQRVEAADIVPATDAQELERRVILWCVEAYFGHLGGDPFGRGRLHGAGS